MTLALRPFAADDDAALIAWIGSAEELERFAGSSLAWPLTADQLDRIRADPKAHAWTACTDPATQAAVGHAELIVTGEDTGRIARVLLDPARRGEGLGGALVAAIVNRARALGITRLSLNVLAGNEPAIRTYRRLGFADAGSDPADPRVRIYALGALYDR